MKKQTFEQTQRALLALIQDMRELEKAHERTREQIYALAKHHGVEVPV